MDPYYSHYRKYKAKYLALCQQEKEMQQQQQQQQQQYGGYDEDQLERYYKYKARKYRKKYKDLVGGMMVTGTNTWRHTDHRLTLEERVESKRQLFNSMINSFIKTEKVSDLGAISSYTRADTPKPSMDATFLNNILAGSGLPNEPLTGTVLMDFGNSDSKKYVPGQGDGAVKCPKDVAMDNYAKLFDNAKNL